MTQATINGIAYKVIGCAIEIHKHLGPGLLESVYHECLLEELSHHGFNVQSQLWVPLYYREKLLQGKLKLDLLVENRIIIEIKAVETVLPVHKAQLLSYLRLACKPKGILINFHVENIAQNAVHVVTDSFAQLPKF